MEGVAFQQSPNGKIRALYHTETGNGNIRILGTGRHEPAVLSQMGRYGYLIESDQQEKKFLKQMRECIKHVLRSLLPCPLHFYPDGPFFQTRSAEAIVF